jgi:hypothetical protein
MKVIIELEVENCKDCPNYTYEGTSWSEDVYTCKETKYEVNGEGVPSNCPFIESTMEKLRQLTVISQVGYSQNLNTNYKCYKCDGEGCYKCK